MTTIPDQSPPEVQVRLCTNARSELAALTTQNDEGGATLTGTFVVTTLALAGNGTEDPGQVTYAIPADSLPDLLGDLLALWTVHRQNGFDQHPTGNPGPVDAAMILAETLDLFMDHLAGLGPEVHPVDRATSKVILDVGRSVVTTAAAEILMQLHTYGADPADLDAPTSSLEVQPPPPAEEEVACPLCSSYHTERRHLPSGWACLDCGHTFAGPAVT